MSLPIEEQWRPIPGYEGLYEASDLGRIRNRHGLVRKTGRVQGGYEFLALRRDKVRSHLLVHRLVLMAFDRVPREDEVARHLNGNPRDNRLENLAWGTPSENMQDAVRHGVHPQARKTHCPRGHRYGPSKTGGNRKCGACQIARVRCPDCDKEMARQQLPRHRRLIHGVGEADEGRQRVTDIPQRIQRKRVKGWRMPEGAVYVGRPSRWGNPYVVLSSEILVHDDGRDWWCPAENGGAQAAAVEMFRADLLADRLPIARISTMDAIRRELAGRDLACWCPLNKPCHADVLLELANHREKAAAEIGGA